MASSTSKSNRRWAIIGTGDVAGKFVIGLRSAPGAEVAVIASRSADRAAVFAAQFGIARSLGSYEEAAKLDVDAVYIATPASEHLANALLFISAGKPVLIEKPFAACAADAEAIVAAARAMGVFCMEGVWTRFLPALQLARDMIAEGRIGTPRYLRAGFAIAEVVDPANSLFRTELGGGVTAHRGVYPISLALDLLGPATLGAAATAFGETGVDEEMSAILHHANGALSSLHAGARTSDDNGLSILGTEGRLQFAGPIYRPFGVRIESLVPRRRDAANWNRMAILKQGAFAQGLRQRLDGWITLGSKPRLRRAPYHGNGYTHEAEAVMQALCAGWTEHPLMPLEESLATARLVDAIKARNLNA